MCSWPFDLFPSSPQRHALLHLAGDNNRALVHVLEALPRSLYLTSTEFQGGAPHLAFLLQLPRCQPLSTGRKMAVVAGSMGTTATAGCQKLSEVFHAKEDGVAHKSREGSFTETENSVPVQLAGHPMCLLPHVSAMLSFSSQM